MTHSTFLTHSHRRLSQGKAPWAIIVADKLELAMA
jgi:hypothetical protein